MHSSKSFQPLARNFRTGIILVIPIYANTAKLCPRLCLWLSILNLTLFSFKVR